MGETVKERGAGIGNFVLLKSEMAKQQVREAYEKAKETLESWGYDFKGGYVFNPGLGGGGSTRTVTLAIIAESKDRSARDANPLKDQGFELQPRSVITWPGRKTNLGDHELAFTLEGINNPL